MQRVHHSKEDDRPFFPYFGTQTRIAVEEGQSIGTQLKPDLFGNLSNDRAHEGVEEVFFNPNDLPIPAFLPDTPETREELAQYYQFYENRSRRCTFGRYLESSRR